MEQLVFAYGTLLETHVQEAVIGRVIDGVPDRLHGYSKSDVIDGPETFPSLKADPKAYVEGRVLTVSQTELKHIDMYEGDLYARHKVTLESGTQAWVYIS